MRRVLRLKATEKIQCPKQKNKSYRCVLDGGRSRIDRSYKQIYKDILKPSGFEIIRVFERKVNEVYKKVYEEGIDDDFKL